MAGIEESLSALSGLKDTLAGAASAKAQTEDRSAKGLDGIEDSNESLEELVARLEESLTEEMKKILDAITGKNNTDSKDTKNAAKNVFSQEDIDQLAGAVNPGTDSEDITPPKSGKVLPTDLNKIDQNFALGSLLVYYKLDEIKNVVNDLAAKLKKSGAEKAPSKGGGDEKEPKIGKGESLMTMAMSLKEFAKAALLLAFIPKAAASLGIALFIKYTEAFNEMADKVDTAKQKEFLENLQTMADAVKKFAIACVIISITIPFLLVAIPGMMLIKVLAKLAGEAGELVGEQASNLVILAVGATMLAVAFILFGLAFIVMASTLKYIPKALLGIAAVMLIIALTCALGAIMTYAVPILLIFPVVAILVSLGYIMMFAAVLILSKFKFKKEQIQQNIDAIKAFLLSTIELGLACLPLIPLMIPFILVSTLLFAGFTAIFLALFILALTSYFIGNGKWIDTAVGKIIGFISAFGNEEFLKVVALGAVGAVLLTVASALLLVSFAALTLGFLLLKAMNALIPDPTLIDNVLGPDGLLGKILKYVTDMGVQALVASVACIPLAVFAVLFSVAMLGLTLAVGATVLVDKLLQNIKNPGEIGDKLRDVCVNIILSIMGLEADGSISLGDTIKGGITLVGMTACALLMVPFAVAMALAMTSFLTTVLAVKGLKKELDQFTPADIQQVMDILGIILNSLADSAKAFKGTAADTITAMGSLVKDVATAIDTLTNVVIKLKDGIPEEQIDAAVTAIKQICEKLFGDGSKVKKGEYNLTVLFKSLASSELKNLRAEACEALIPIINAIDSLADLVIRLGDEDQFSEARIAVGTENVKRFAGLMVDVAEAMQTLVHVDGGWLGKKLFGNKSPLESVQEVAASGFFEDLKKVMENMTDTANVVGKVPTDEYTKFLKFFRQDFSSFADSSKEFKVAMGYLDDAFGKLRRDTLANYKMFLETNMVDSKALTQTVSTLSQLAVMAPKFASIAGSFERIAAAMDNMSKKADKVGKLFKTVAESEKGASDTAASTDSASKQSTGIDPNTALIYGIISNWNKDGVPIRAKYDEKEKILEPDDVGNKTGKNKPN